MKKVQMDSHFKCNYICIRD